MGQVVIRRFLVAAALAAVLLAAPGAARVAPITPEQKLMIDRQDALENAVRDRFSDGTFNQLRDMYGSVIVAEERAGRPTAPRVLFKDEYGWHELRERGRRKLPRSIARELDRLFVAGGQIWNEVPYTKDAHCAAPQVFVLRYAGNQLYGGQCSPAGLSGRVARVAATLRVPSGKATTIAPPRDPRESLGPAEDMAGQVSNRAREMIYAWDRRSLAGAVDPYAENVIVQFEDGRVLRGRAALIAWMRPQQDWSVPVWQRRGESAACNTNAASSKRRSAIRSSRCARSAGRRMAGRCGGPTARPGRTMAACGRLSTSASAPTSRWATGESSGPRRS